MKIATTAFILCALGLPVTASAQKYSSYSASSPKYSAKPASVLLPGEPGWRNYANIPDGPCGCSTPVRMDCYDECCPSCHCHCFCLLRNLGRMLDCLLPCNKCGHGCGGCGGCGLFGGCCGNGCGCGGMAGGSCCGPAFGLGCSSCCEPSCSSCAVPSCSSSIPLPGPPVPSADPFIDDPATPVPTPHPTSRSKSGAEVRWNPMLRKSVAAAPTARPPQKQPASQPPRGETVVVKRAAAPTSAMARTAPAMPAAAPAKTTKVLTATAQPNLERQEPSVLRRTSHESELAEPAPLKLLVSAAPLVESPAVSEATKDFEIPRNPLRP